jgi:mono/diheme cytochrome c family protein
MRKYFLYIPITLLLSVIAAPEIIPGLKAGNKNTTPVTVSSIPDELKEIFKSSCMNCHATDGKLMAKAKLNFSDWDTYNPGKQAQKAADICKMITKDSMPPKSFREKNPQAVPSAAQKDMICKWSKSLAPDK